jgi:hypothetical protein
MQIGITAYPHKNNNYQQINILIRKKYGYPQGQISSKAKYLLDVAWHCEYNRRDIPK